jgi:hypothetical protein
VTPPGIGDFTRIAIIEPSHYAAGTAYIAANRYQLGDKKPLIYRTTDFGKTWTLIVSGIDDEHYLRVVREDPVRRGLLFAGTERGVYVSFDDGANWRSMRRNLPLVPVHDLRIKDGDLIAATHGRGFWVMDNISALRQVTPAIVASSAHLFKPTDAWRTNWGGGFMAQMMDGGGAIGANPPGGAGFQYWLKDTNQTVRFEFLDAAGKTITGFTSDQDPDTQADSMRLDGLKTAMIDSLTSKAGLSRDSATKVATARMAPGGGGAVDFEEMFSRAARPARVPNKAGMNNFNWNMRYPDAARFDGMIMWAGSVTGPVAPPGTYSVRMTAGTTVQTHPFRVRKDPRSDATDADLAAQFKTMLAIRDRTTDANMAVRSVRNMRWQVGDRAPKLTGQPSIEFQSLANQMMAELTGAEEEVYQTRNQSSQDPLNYPIKLNNQIAALAGTVGSGEYRPTMQAQQAFSMLSGKLEVHLVAIQKSLDTRLPRLNAILRANGIAELTPSNEEIKPNRPKIAM